MATRWLDPSRHLVDWLFVPLLAQWIVVVAVVYPAYGRFLAEAGSFTFYVNRLFPLTWACAFGLFGTGIWWFARAYHVDAIRTVVYAFSLVVAATSSFEILWQNVGAGFGVGNHQLEGQIINLSSILMAVSSLRFWRAGPLFLGLLAAFLAGWLLWLAVGYPQEYSPVYSHALVADLFNVVLKVGAFVLLGILVMPFRRNIGPSFVDKSVVEPAGAPNVN
jgi:hypothetical protein